MDDYEYSDESPSLEEAYSDVRNILEASTHFMTRFTVDSEYLGKDANNGLEVIPPLNNRGKDGSVHVRYEAGPPPKPRHLKKESPHFHIVLTHGTRFQLS